MEAGLAASAVTNTYGSGAGNTVTHSYGGAGHMPAKQSVSKKKVKSKKKKGSTMACKNGTGKGKK